LSLCISKRNLRYSNAAVARACRKPSDALARDLIVSAQLANTRMNPCRNLRVMRSLKI
jgi:hypothetical protein